MPCGSRLGRRSVRSAAGRRAVVALVAELQAARTLKIAPADGALGDQTSAAETSSLNQ